MAISKYTTPTPSSYVPQDIPIPVEQIVNPIARTGEEILRRHDEGIEGLGVLSGKLQEANSLHFDNPYRQGLVSKYSREIEALSNNNQLAGVVPQVNALARRFAGEYAPIQRRAELFQEKEKALREDFHGQDFNRRYGELISKFGELSPEMIQANNYLPSDISSWAKPVNLSDVALDAAGKIERFIDPIDLTPYQQGILRSGEISRLPPEIIDAALRRALLSGESGNWVRDQAKFIADEKGISLEEAQEEVIKSPIEQAIISKARSDPKFTYRSDPTFDKDGPSGTLATDGFGGYPLILQEQQQKGLESPDAAKATVESLMDQGTLLSRQLYDNGQQVVKQPDGSYQVQDRETEQPVLDEGAIEIAAKAREIEDNISSAKVFQENIENDILGMSYNEYLQRNSAAQEARSAGEAAFKGAMASSGYVKGEDGKWKQSIVAGMGAAPVLVDAGPVPQEILDRAERERTKVLSRRDPKLAQVNEAYSERANTIRTYEAVPILFKKSEDNTRVEELVRSAIVEFSKGDRLNLGRIQVFDTDSNPIEDPEVLANINPKDITLEGVIDDPGQGTMLAVRSVDEEGNGIRMLVPPTSHMDNVLYREAPEIRRKNLMDQFRTNVGNRIGENGNIYFNGDTLRTTRNMGGGYTVEIPTTDGGKKSVTFNGRESAVKKIIEFYFGEK